MTQGVFLNSFNMPLINVCVKHQCLSFYGYYICMLLLHATSFVDSQACYSLNDLLNPLPDLIFWILSALLVCSGLSMAKYWLQMLACLLALFSFYCGLGFCLICVFW